MFGIFSLLNLLLYKFFRFNTNVRGNSIFLQIFLLIFQLHGFHWYSNMKQSAFCFCDIFFIRYDALSNVSRILSFVCFNNIYINLNKRIFYTHFYSHLIILDKFFVQYVYGIAIKDLIFQQRYYSESYMYQGLFQKLVK